LGAAIICGLIGAGESGKRARNAAAGCGAIGAGIGAYMDHQEKILREQLVGTGVQVAREGDNIRLIMPNNITFATDRYDLKPSFADTLDSVILVLNKYPDTRLAVVGHTDSVGAVSYNQTLSEKRARAVADYLMSRQVEPSRITTAGAGETQPIASNVDEAGRAQNRRVELSIIPQPA
jgi:outer membrane protein OmpA-like peptidoglycan-associated protein